MSFETTQVQYQRVHYKNWPTASLEKQNNGREGIGCRKKVSVTCSGLEGRQKATPRAWYYTIVVIWKL